MKRALVTLAVFCGALCMAGCDRSPSPEELFTQELILAVVSFFLALGIAAVARATSNHLVVKGHAPTPEELQKGRDPKTSLAIAFFVAILFLGGFIATSAIIKKRNLVIPHGSSYHLPKFYLWGVYTVFDEDIYFAFMINGKVPFDYFQSLLEAIQERRADRLQAEIEEDGGRVSPRTLFLKTALSYEETEQIKLALSGALSIILFMIPAYFGARSRKRLWLVPLIFLALNVVMNLFLYADGKYPSLPQMGAGGEAGDLFIPD